MQTHPKDRDTPMLAHASSRCAGGHTGRPLKIRASYHPHGDWQLRVRVGKEVLADKLVSFQTVQDEWFNLEVDLTQFARPTRRSRESRTVPTTWRERVGGYWAPDRGGQRVNQGVVMKEPVMCLTIFLLLTLISPGNRARRGGPSGEHRLLSRRRSGLESSRVFRQFVLRDATHRPIRPRGGAVHACLCRLPRLFPDPGQHPDRQVSGPTAPDRLAAGAGGLFVPATPQCHDHPTAPGCRGHAGRGAERAGLCDGASLASGISAKNRGPARTRFRSPHSRGALQLAHLSRAFWREDLDEQAGGLPHRPRSPMRRSDSSRRRRTGRSSSISPTSRFTIRSTVARTWSKSISASWRRRRRPAAMTSSWKAIPMIQNPSVARNST